MELLLLRLLVVILKHVNIATWFLEGPGPFILKGKFTPKLFFDICFDIGLTSLK